MKKIKISKFQSIYLLLFLGLTISCKKTPPEKPNPEPTVYMPALTHQGLNTFGCYINGEPFVAKVNSSFTGLPAVWGSFNEETQYFLAQGKKRTGVDPDIRIQNVSIKTYVTDSAGVYDVYFTTDEFQGYIDIGGYNCTYYHDLMNKGTIEITFLDETNNIISGKFEMDLINPDCPLEKVMHITDGRFDINY